MTSAPDWQRVISIAGADTLTAVTPNLAAGGASSLSAGTAIRSYSGFLVNLWPEAGGAGKRIAVRIINNTRSYTSPLQTVKLPPAASLIGGATPGVILGFPVQAVQGDQIEVEFYAIDAAFFFAAVIGVDIMPTNLPILRPDGRLPPSGLAVASNAVLAVGTVNVIAPVGAGLSVLLHSMNALISPTAGGNAFTEAQGTIGGVAIDLLELMAGPSNGSVAAIHWPNGLLLDPNTALIMTLSGVAATTRVTAIYDVVL